MLRVLFVIVIGIALSGCELAQPYAALSYQPSPQPTPPTRSNPARNSNSDRGGLRGKCYSP